MEIKLKVDDITTFAKALQNAGVAYQAIVNSIMLGCDVPNQFEPLKSLSDNELANRLDALRDVYMQVEKIEKNKQKTLEDYKELIEKIKTIINHLDVQDKQSARKALHEKGLPDNFLKVTNTNVLEEILTTIDNFSK